MRTAYPLEMQSFTNDRPQRARGTGYARGAGMRLTRTPQESHEPIGIVIADGGTGDHISRFSAFVWGPVPDEEPVLPARTVTRDLVGAGV